MEDQDAGYRRDPKYRKFVLTIEKLLQSFDTVSDWADIIAFLSRFSKALHAFPQFPTLPCQIVAAKRLAQCLNPALPAGVHLKTLEVYSQIFERIGSMRISEDLALFSIGLFPLFQHASMLVKPAVLGLFDRFYLPLGQRLLPCLKALVLAVLSGLEEESGESFMPVLNLFDRLSDIAGPPRFLRVVFFILGQNAQWRLAALHYLLRRLPKFDSKEAMSVCLGDGTTLAVSAIHHAVTDSNLLVQRNALELLVVHFPLTYKLFDTEALTMVMGSSVAVVLRKEMSLNRRLYAWLLGPSDDKEHFDKLAKPYLLEALKTAFNSSPVDAISASRPYKILLSLLDRSDVGVAVIEGVLLTVLESAQRHIQQNPALASEIQQTFSMFVRMTAPDLVWRLVRERLLDLLQSGHADQDQIKAMIQSVVFLQGTVRTDDQETIRVHVPDMAMAICNYVKDFTAEDVIAMMWLLLPLFKLLKSLKQIRPETASFDEVTWHWSMLQPLMKRWISFMATNQLDLATNQHQDYVDFFALLAQLALHQETMTSDDLRFDLLQLVLSSESFNIVQIGLNGYFECANLPALLFTQTEAIELVRKLWHFLDQSHVVYRQSVCSMFKKLTPFAELVEDELLMLLHEAKDVGELHLGIERFDILWTLSGQSLHRCMFFVIEHVLSMDPLTRSAAEMWLKGAIKQLPRIIDPMMRALLADPILRTVNEEDSGMIYYRQMFDQRRVNYVLEVLLMVTKAPKESNSFIGVMGEDIVSHDILQRFRNKEKHLKTQSVPSLKEEVFPTSGMTYLRLIIPVLLRFVQSEVPTQLVSKMKPLNRQTQLLAAQLMEQFLVHSRIFSRNAEELVELQSQLLNKLWLCTRVDNLPLQVPLLRVLRLVVVRRYHSALKSDGSVDDNVMALGQSTFDAKDVGIAHPIGGDPKLLECLLQVLTLPSHVRVRPRWIEFVLAILTWLKPFFKVLAVPIITTFSSAIEDAAKTLQDRYVALEQVHVASQNGHDEFNTGMEETDIASLLRGVTEIVSFCLGSDNNNVRDDEIAESMDTLGLRYLADLVKDVFIINDVIDDAQSTMGDYQKDGPHHAVKESVTISFPHVIHSMTSLSLSLSDPSVQRHYLCHQVVAERLKMEALQLFKMVQDEYVAAIAENWAHENRAYVVLDQPRGFAYSNDRVHALLNGPLAVIQKDVWLKVLARMMRTMYLVKTKPWRAYLQRKKLNDMIIVRFIEMLLPSLPVPVVFSSFSLFMTYARECLLQPASHKNRFLPLLRLFVALHERAPFSSSEEDKKQRKDFQDIFQRICDGCILLGGRSFDQTSWLRRKIDDEISIQSNDHEDEGVGQAVSTGAGFAIFAENQPRTAAFFKEEKLHIQTMRVLSQFLVSGIRMVLDEATQTVSLITNFMYYIAGPYLKTTSLRRSSHGIPFLQIVVAITKNPFWLKLWRRDVWDCFLDNSFFPVNPEALVLWTTVLHNTLLADREKLNELIVRINTTSSTALFVSKEGEFNARAQLLRRLSFLLLCGQPDEHLRVLPGVLERIVESFKLNVPSIYEEVFRCLRVLLVRVSQQHLASFWPVVLTESARILAITASQMAGRPSGWLLTSDNVEAFISSTNIATPTATQPMNGMSSGGAELNLPGVPSLAPSHLLALCKFLDMALMLASDEFQMFQWVFVGESVLELNSVSPTIASLSPSPWLESALPKAFASSSSVEKHRETRVELSRPLLGVIRSLSHARQLTPFAHHLAAHLYHAQLSLVPADATHMASLLFQEFTDESMQTTDVSARNAKDAL